MVKGDDSGKTLDLFDYGVWVMFRWGLANPAADALAVFGRAGVDDFGFLSATIGAFHGRSS